MSSGEESPFGLAKEVEQLMKLPQHLCKQRGICCRVATFKGSLGVPEIQELAKEDSLQGEMARDFLSIFEPYPTLAEVQALAAEFVERVRASAAAKGRDPDQTDFFGCRFVLPDGRCGVHEDRPVGCRTYPFPHEKMIYHPGCGFEQQGKQNWARIKEILESLGLLSEFSDGD